MGLISWSDFQRAVTVWAGQKTAGAAGPTLQPVKLSPALSGTHQVPRDLQKLVMF